MPQQQANLFQNGSRRELCEPNQKLGERSGAFRILGIETLGSNFAQDFISQLSVVDLFRKNGETLGHGFGEMFVKLKTLHNADLGREYMSVMLDRKTYNLIYA